MTKSTIEAFLMIVKVGNITNAAKRLYISQPALSKRIENLEKDLGYCLFKRHKGIPNIELTDEGLSFISIAEKWLNLWQECKSLRQINQQATLKISAIGSIGQYLLPKIFTIFIQKYPECRLIYHQHHSLEAYHYIAKNKYDLAFISDDMYSREVDTIPLFKEKMVLISKQQMNYPLSVLDLDPQQEIRLPWHPEYDLWHNHWFSINTNPLITIDQMPIMEYFLTQDNTWAITPYSVAIAIKNKQNCYIYTLNESPDDMIIYYLQSKTKPSSYALNFLSICKQELQQYEYFTLLS